MKYYILRNSIGKDVGGIFPQVKESIHHCDVWNEPKFIEHIQFAKAPNDVIISNAILQKKAKITDLVSAGGIGFTNKLLISDKLKKIIENKTESGIQFFKNSIFHNNNEYKDYWLLNMYTFNNDFIDYGRSEIYLMDGIFDVIKQISVKNYHEFNKEIKIVEEKGGYPLNISIKSFYILNEINQDFFMLKYIDSGLYIVSEKLKEEIEDAGCTGIEFQPSELSYNEWTAPGGEREKVYGKS